jgi:hypothetical protein
VNDRQDLDLGAGRPLAERDLVESGVTVLGPIYREEYSHGFSLQS